MLVFADLTEACGEDPRLVCEKVFEWTESESLARTVDWVLDRPLRILLILVCAWILNLLVRRAIDRMVERLVREREEEELAAETEVESLLSNWEERANRKLAELRRSSERSAQRSRTLGTVLKGLATFAILVVTALLVLGELGINLGPLVAGAGIAGVALGFGAQTMVKDFLAGTFMVIEDQFGIGDVIDLGPATGVVEDVTLRTTQVRDLEGVLWTVPNGEIARIGNHSQLWSRAVLDIDIAYDTDIGVALRVIGQVVADLRAERRADAAILDDPEILGVERLGEGAVTIRLAVKTDPNERWNAARTIRWRLKEAFDEAGIVIPFPQREVALRTVE